MTRQSESASWPASPKLAGGSTALTRIRKASQAGGAPQVPPGLIPSPSRDSIHLYGGIQIGYLAPQAATLDERPRPYAKDCQYSTQAKLSRFTSNSQMGGNHEYERAPHGHN